MADKDTKAMEGFLKNLRKEKNALKKKYPGAEGEAMIRELFVKAAPKPKAKDNKKMMAAKGGMAKKKTKYMAKGGAMKKTKYMAKGGAMKKTKYMAKGGVAKKK